MLVETHGATAGVQIETSSTQDTPKQKTNINDDQQPTMPHDTFSRASDTISKSHRCYLLCRPSRLAKYGVRTSKDAHCRLTGRAFVRCAPPFRLQRRLRRNVRLPEGPHQAPTDANVANQADEATPIFFHALMVPHSPDTAQAHGQRGHEMAHMVSQCLCVAERIPTLQSRIPHDTFFRNDLEVTRDLGLSQT